MKKTNNDLRRLKAFLLTIILLSLASCGGKQDVQQKETVIETVMRRDILVEISATGTVLPRNRLEVKPAQGGRIEEIYVKEGDKVKAGDVLCKMSSTERAALIDTAGAVGKEESEYWKEVYKPMPVIAPIEGEVIVRSVEPGQTINAGSPVVVLSDCLIVRARVDETDIGKVSGGQRARIELDAYPEVKVEGVVEHISYESKVVNNVTVYEVNILPDKIPSVFRSGMNAIVTIACSSKTNVVAIPVGVVREENSKKWVMISDKNGKQYPREIKTGFKNDLFVEVIAGLKEGELIVVTKRKFTPSAKKAQNNPLGPPKRSGSVKTR